MQLTCKYLPGRRIFIGSFLLMFTIRSMGGNSDKAHFFMEQGQYKKASVYLDKEQGKSPNSFMLNYEMARFYFYGDNPRFSIDSANIYIKLCRKNWPADPDDKQFKSALKIGLRSYTLNDLQNRINQNAFAEANKVNSIAAYQNFIDHYDDSLLLVSARRNRNELAFNRAKASMDFTSFKEFIEKFPDAEQTGEAREMYDRLLYIKQTSANTWQAYKNFLDQYPTSPFVKDARNNYDSLLFVSVIRSDDPITLYSFIEKNPGNPFVGLASDSLLVWTTPHAGIDEMTWYVLHYPAAKNIAYVWDVIYCLVTSDDLDSIYLNFDKDYPGYPNASRFKSDLQKANYHFTAFEENEKWGYKWEGSDSIAKPAIYADALEFSGRLAAVASAPCIDGKCKYGFINKSFIWAIDPAYDEVDDFKSGYALVGQGDCPKGDCHYGVINELGRWVLLPVYDVISDYSEGTWLVQLKGRGYQFIDARGNDRIGKYFAGARSFKDEYAAVQDTGLWYFIDHEGQQLSDKYFKMITDFSETKAAVTVNGELWGFIDQKGNWFMEPQFKSVEPFKNGVSTVTREDKIVKKRKTYFELNTYTLHADGKLEKMKL